MTVEAPPTCPYEGQTECPYKGGECPYVGPTGCRHQVYCDKLVEDIPEVEFEYKELCEGWHDEPPGLHIVYGDVLTPYIIRLLESGNNSEGLRRVFNLVEAMCGDENVGVQEVAVVTVLEGLEWNPEWRRLMMPYLGPLSKEAIEYLAEFWRGDRQRALLGIRPSGVGGEREGTGQSGQSGERTED